METLLLLEDEPLVMEFLRRVLRGYNLLEATTAEEALRLFDAHGRQVDVLVSDVTLPTSSGIQVALLLRSEIPDLPVILTSGYPIGEWTGRECADLQRLGRTSVSLLTKPFHIQDLLSTLRKLTNAVPSDVAKMA